MTTNCLPILMYAQRTYVYALAQRTYAFALFRHTAQGRATQLCRIPSAQRLALYPAMGYRLNLKKDLAIVLRSKPGCPELL